MEQMRKLRIGIQTFEDIRKDNYLYVERLPIGNLRICSILSDHL